MAVIQLTEDAPRSVERAVLRPHVIDTGAKVYGFRGKEVGNGVWQSHPDGEWALGKIVGPHPGGRAQFDGIRQGAGVEKGFSGGGVYDPIQDAVVGMIVESDRDKARGIAQFIDTSSLEEALKGIPGVEPGSQLGKPTARPRSVSAETVVQTQQQLGEIETYLQQVSDSLTPADPDTRLLPYLQGLLGGRTAKGEILRSAFGLPKDPHESRNLYSFVFSPEPQVQPLVGVVVQRLYHILWRYEATLREHVRASWAEPARKKVRAVKDLCESSLVARPPTLLDLSAALKFEKELKPFTEVAPDPTLYAVLRALSSAEQGPLPADTSVIQKATKSAMDFLHAYLLDLVANRRPIDDSSNAWWAVRTGIQRKDTRFHALLGQVATKFNDVKVPAVEVGRQAAVPEIYVSLRTASYTLSNIQALFEVHPDMENQLVEQLHGILQVMLQRLLNTQRNNQLYLASVHYEGLRNYLDYVEQQKLADVSRSGSSSNSAVDDSRKKKRTIGD